MGRTGRTSRNRGSSVKAITRRSTEENTSAAHKLLGNATARPNTANDEGAHDTRSPPVSAPAKMASRVVTWCRAL